MSKSLKIKETEETRVLTNEFEILKKQNYVYKNKYLKGIIEDIEKGRYLIAIAKIKLALSNGRIENLKEKWAVEILKGKKIKECDENSVFFFKNPYNLQIVLNRIALETSQKQKYIPAIFAYGMLLEIEDSESTKTHALQILSALKQEKIKITKRNYSMLKDMYETAGDILYNLDYGESGAIKVEFEMGGWRYKQIMTKNESKYFYQLALEAVGKLEEAMDPIDVIIFHREYTDIQIETARLYAKQGRLERARDEIDRLHYPNAIRALLRISTEENLSEAERENAVTTAVNLSFEYLLTPTVLEYVGIYYREEFERKQSKILKIVEEEFALAERLGKDTTHLSNFIEQEKIMADAIHKPGEPPVRTLWKDVRDMFGID